MPSSGCQTCARSEEHTSELQSHDNLVCRLLLEKKNKLQALDHGGQTTTEEQGRAHEEASARVLVRVCALESVCSAGAVLSVFVVFFFFKDPATTEIYPLPLHDALPISAAAACSRTRRAGPSWSYTAARTSG